MGLELQIKLILDVNQRADSEKEIPEPTQLQVIGLEVPTLVISEVKDNLQHNGIL